VFSDTGAKPALVAGIGNAADLCAGLRPAERISITDLVRLYGITHAANHAHKEQICPQKT